MKIYDSEQFSFSFSNSYNLVTPIFNRVYNFSSMYCLFQTLFKILKSISRIHSLIQNSENFTFLGPSCCSNKNFSLHFMYFFRNHRHFFIVASFSFNQPTPNPLLCGSSYRHLSACLVTRSLPLRLFLRIMTSQHSYAPQFYFWYFWCPRK